MKKLVFLLAIVLALPLILASCSEESTTVQVGREEIEKKDIAEQNNAYTLIEIIDPKYNDDGTLVYDSHTKIVYYHMSYSVSGGYSRAYMCPYYSENGKLCRYNVETNQIEEINN